jgi:hypothetical protein
MEEEETKQNGGESNPMSLGYMDADESDDTLD